MEWRRAQEKEPRHDDFSRHQTTKVVMTTGVKWNGAVRKKKNLVMTTSVVIKRLKSRESPPPRAPPGRSTDHGPRP
jgi:hypothetical protein